MNAPRTPIVLERCRSDETSATGHFRVGRQSTAVRFDGVAPNRRSVAEAFAAIARVMGMETDQPVISIPPLSRTFRREIDVFQRTHLSLFPEHHRAPIHSLHRFRRRGPSGGDGRRVAAFFSGGVDSFDLLVEHGDEVDDLIFVRGFDVSVHDRARNEEVLAVVRAAADHTGKPLIVIDTDLRDFSDQRTDWTWFVYGGLLATALLLERTHHTVLCAASVADRHLPEEAVRLRSAPFGNGRTALRIVGREATRVEKIEAVADAGIARDTLRVCWQNSPGTINCGRCHKCLRTHVALAAVGGLGAISTFADTVDLEAVATHPATTRSDRAYLAEIRVAARANGHADIVGALDRALDVGEVEAP